MNIVKEPNMPSCIFWTVCFTMCVQSMCTCQRVYVCERYMVVWPELGMCGLGAYICLVLCTVACMGIVLGVYELGVGVCEHGVSVCK